MRDHRFMYPKVVPVAGKEPVAGATVHNFAPRNLRNSLRASRISAPQPKTATSL
jgi:hypothetical protein